LNIVIFVLIELAIFLVGVIVGYKLSRQETYVIPCPDDLDEEKVKEIFENIIKDIDKDN
jgi:uncharacterized protein YneF (UPF0154 family)